MAKGRLLILLVGSNPLPNYLAACALRPSFVVLVYTEETKNPKDRLRSALTRPLGGSVTLEDSYVEDATCSTEVRRVFDSLMGRAGDWDLLLNYTGGTKVMAAHARMAFSVGGGLPEHASYLEETGTNGQVRLRFDDGTWKLLSDYEGVSLDLDTVLGLHGIKHEPRSSRTPAPTLDDAREIVCKVLADPPLAAALYCECKRLEEFKNPNRALSEPFQANGYGLSLSLPEFPTTDQLGRMRSGEKASWFKQWYKFIGGTWLEDWLGAQLRVLAPELGIDAERDVTVGVNAERSSRQRDDPMIEMDIAVVRGCRSYFISCTTDSTKHLCKSKLFEIDVRARQLGGDLARAALVCLADDQVVRSLRHDIQDAWGSRNTARVFGQSDIRAWSDCDARQPNRHSLKDWLES